MGFSGSAEIAVRECMPNGVWFFVIKNRHIICMRKADDFIIKQGGTAGLPVLAIFIAGAVFLFLCKTKSILFKAR